MTPAAAIVYFDLEKTAFRGQAPHYLRPLPGGGSGLERLLSELNSLRLPILAPANGPMSSGLRAALRRYGARPLELAPGADYLESCRRALARHPARTAVLCRPEAFLARAALIRRQMRLHREAGCRYSFCLDLPFGLAPEIIDSDLLSELGRFWQDFGPWLGGCLASHRRPHDQHGALGVAARSLGVRELYPAGCVMIDSPRAWRRALALLRSGRAGRPDQVVRYWRARDAADAQPRSRAAAPPRRRAARKTRIACLLPRADLHGGVQVAAVQLLGALDRSRFEPLALCPEPGPASRSLARQGVPAAYFGPFPSWRGWSLDHGDLAQPERLAQRARIMEALERFRPSVVHYHGFDRVMAAAAAAAGIPSILHAHGYLHVPNPDPPSVHAARRDYGYELRLVDRFIAVNRCVAESLRAVGLPPSRIRVVHNGVDAGRFAPERGNAGRWRSAAGLQGAEPLLVSVGRLDENRRLELLLVAFKKLAERRPAARLALVGQASFEGYERRLRNAIGALDLEGRVVLASAGARVEDALAAADVVIDPRTMNVCPLAVLEAMAAGKPVVAAGDAGCAELISDGRSGLLVPPEDPAALARAIERVLSSPDLARRLAAGARRRAVSRFTLERQARLVERVYEELRS